MSQIIGRDIQLHIALVHWFSSVRTIAQFGTPWKIISHAANKNSKGTAKDYFQRICKRSWASWTIVTPQVVSSNTHWQHSLWVWRTCKKSKMEMHLNVAKEHFCKPDIYWNSILWFDETKIKLSVLNSLVMFEERRIKNSSHRLPCQQ